jgi:LPXTG-site transpeptidase (sortase) family protein
MVRAPGGRRVWLAAAGAVLVAGGLVAHHVQTPDEVGAERSGTVVAPEPTMSAPTSTARDAIPAPRVSGMPTRVVIPALGVDAPVRPIRAPGGVLIPPSDPQELGWWADGAEPGATRGSALVTGHTVHTGGGALDDLETLQVGDLVKVHTSHGWVRYAVRDTEVYDKGNVARHAQRLFSQEAPGRLVLITCEDWDGERYLSNVVVTAVPLA